ncbi:hypothetical protein [Herminiimonas sp. KBW02]|uniref:hypothetical protein n=1 Tax=Herminiimonas sp. KBW02 TaxID=2153363 RepID=UPI0011CD374C|nr:hypothetical protein [Herminiimonas sp. KBW02]
MKKTILQLFAISVLISLTLSAHAKEESRLPDQGIERLTQDGNATYAVTPIFSQILLHLRPKGFTDVFEDINPRGYIREAVLQGETLNNWTQMITLTGVKDLALNRDITPRQMTHSVGQRFYAACPNSFTAFALPPQKFSGHDAFAAVYGCGKSPTAFGEKSETTLVISIKGLRDYYAIQWAERNDPSDTPIPADQVKWTERMNALLPVRLCNNTPNDKTAYARCLDNKE